MIIKKGEMDSHVHSPLRGDSPVPEGRGWEPSSQVTSDKSFALQGRSVLICKMGGKDLAEVSKVPSSVGMRRP